jgi:hypothetical protein
MLGKILIVIGLLLIIVSAVIYVCALPVFTFTHLETHTTAAPTQISQIIMDYAFSLGSPEIRAVSFDCTTEQTLNIELTIEQNEDITLSVVNWQPSGEATYFSMRVVGSLSTSWKPNQNGSYYLKFSRDTYPPVYIHANVTKTWTVVYPRSDSETVSEQKPLVNLDLTQMNYLVSGVSVLGCVIAIIGGYAHYKAAPKTNKNQHSARANFCCMQALPRLLIGVTRAKMVGLHIAS